MKIKMKVQMSGTRDGEAWPAPGEEMTVTADEGAKYCASGIALPVRTDKDDVEKRAEAKPEPKPEPKAEAKQEPKHAVKAKAAAEKRGS